MKNTHLAGIIRKTRVGTDNASINEGILKGGVACEKLLV